MAVDLDRIHYKSTSGNNRGWRRSRLGGGSGSHFYAWWAPGGAIPVQHGSFEKHNDAVFLRDIRHHDDHAPLTAGDLAEDYLALGVPDLRSEEYAPEPWTPLQARFARSRAVARILKGHPGSGKTTALLHAADESQAERVLYLTFSRQLATLARDYFDRFCSKDRTFTVLTYSAFLRQLLDWRPANEDAAEARGQFRRDLFNHQRSLGAFASDLDALYDELYAHVVGSALPEKAGRFPKAERMRLSEEAYRSQRFRYLNSVAGNVIDAVRRLERTNDAPLTDRYFPELALAWRAAQALVSGSGKFNRAFLDYGCIAVDEVQDLTPLEAFVVLALARKLDAGGRKAPLLLAGDEAQTVQPTDFEWAWLNDMLHSMIGQTQEFKLAVNLRSPRRIADLVNRSWDYYDYLHKQDRPSGTGYAEIDDDSPDQVLYAAIRPSELPELLTELSTREGLAIVSFDKSSLPREALSFTLSPAEVKGLDFNSVCVVNGGAVLRRITDNRLMGAVEMLEKRLAIDKLRVALSRPTERLIWLDVAPDAPTVKETGYFLHSVAEVTLHPMSAEGLRASLSEEELDIAERVQRCQKDARELIDVKPDLAWSRAHQAVSLLGFPPDLTVIMDPATRQSAHMTLAEVCFQLGFRKKALSPELGRPDLFDQAYRAARWAEKPLLANAFRAIGAIDLGQSADRLNRIATAIQSVTEAGNELPAWLLVEITPRADAWLSELDRHLDAGDNPLIANRILPAFFNVLGFADAQARKDRLVQRSVEMLMKDRRYTDALSILEPAPDAHPKLAAECYEAEGEHIRAAGIYLKLGTGRRRCDVTGRLLTSRRRWDWCGRLRGIRPARLWNG
ncbi:MAG: AAA family ATPase [Bryobacterales bacterium]|nr:AAA family ATPase [Bryobacterales bacterium]